MNKKAPRFISKNSVKKVRAIAEPDPKALQRMQDRTLINFEKWMQLSWALALDAACEYGGYGAKRANELVDAIEKKWEIHDDYDDYDYSIALVTKSLKSRGVDADQIFKFSLNLKSAVREERLRKMPRTVNELDYIKVREQMEEARKLQYSFRESEGLLKK